tara:strand:- start:27 stop:218 length:192 start_codon:yes stop_codon:yes gene_type:complete
MTTKDVQKIIHSNYRSYRGFINEKELAEQIIGYISSHYPYGYNKEAIVLDYLDERLGHPELSA